MNLMWSPVYSTSFNNCVCISLSLVHQTGSFQMRTTWGHMLSFQQQLHVKTFFVWKRHTESSVALMNQSLDSLLSKTLRIVSDNDTDKEIILLVINWSYCETTTGPITSAQCEFDKFFVKIVCTAFSVCTTEPTKNFPRFESQKKSKTFNGRNLQTLNQELYRDIQKKFNVR